MSLRIVTKNIPLKSLESSGVFPHDYYRTSQQTSNCSSTTLWWCSSVNHRDHHFSTQLQNWKNREKRAKRAKRAKRGNYKASEASLENCFKSFKIGRRGMVGVTNNGWQQLDHLHLLPPSFFLLPCTEMKVVAGFHFHTGCPSAGEGRPSFSFSFFWICA